MPGSGNYWGSDDYSSVAAGFARMGILLMVYGGKAAKVINAVLACFMALFTLLHMSELIEGFNPVQLFIMPMMFFIALLMAIDSVKICKS